MNAARYLRMAHAPHGGLNHLQDIRRQERTLCGRGVFPKDGWRTSPVQGRIECLTCRRLAVKRGYLKRGKGRR